MPAGAMIALYPPVDLAERTAIAGEDPSELHVTLVFLGEADKLSIGQVRRLKEIAQAIARSHSPLTAVFSGVGRFTASEDSDGLEPFYLSVDSPQLPALRESITRALNANGIPYVQNHGFSPHLTLAYLPSGTPPPEVNLITEPFPFLSLTLVIAGERQDFLFDGQQGSQRSLVEHYNSDVIDMENTMTIISTGRPFADYKDFDQCVAKNKGKVKNPEGYCAQIHKKVTGKYPGEMAKKKRSELGLVELSAEDLARLEALEIEQEPDSDDREVSVERYHDAFTNAMFERLRGKVSETDWNDIVRYARAKAGGIASADIRKQRREQSHESDAVAKLVLGEPISSLTLTELAALTKKIPVGAS